VNAPILDREGIIRAVAEARRAGRSVALANGCFGILHVGHIRYLQAAAEEADVLVVGVNSDDSYDALAKKARPLVPENERAEIVAAIRGVGLVTIFHETTAEELIRAIRPNVHCKGTDYTVESVPERALVESLGGRVAIVGDPNEHSTTELVEKMKDAGRRAKDGH
jgi:rfaE bifunctional protein nucleotidyltransferase chain/domain